MLRGQFDPDDTEAEVAPHTAGPIAAQAVGWSSYRHDSGYSQTLWVYEMPRQPVPMTWMTPLFTRTVGRRAVTTVAEPVPAQLAQLATRRDKVARAGDEVTKRRMRLVRTAREDEEARAVKQVDREQARRSRPLPLRALVTVTADSAERSAMTPAVRRILVGPAATRSCFTENRTRVFAAGALPLARGLKPAAGVGRVTPRADGKVPGRDASRTPLDGGTPRRRGS